MGDNLTGTGAGIVQTRYLTCPTGYPAVGTWRLNENERSRELV